MSMQRLVRFSIREHIFNPGQHFPPLAHWFVTSPWLPSTGSKTSPASTEGGTAGAGESETGTAAGRKRRWGSSTAVTAKKPSISITTDSLKVLRNHRDQGRVSAHFWMSVWENEIDHFQGLPGFRKPVEKCSVWETHINKYFIWHSLLKTSADIIFFLKLMMAVCKIIISCQKWMQINRVLYWIIFIL